MSVRNKLGCSTVLSSFKYVNLREFNKTGVVLQWFQKGLRTTFKGAATW